MGMTAKSFGPWACCREPELLTCEEFMALTTEELPSPLYISISGGCGIDLVVGPVYLESDNRPSYVSWGEYSPQVSGSYGSCSSSGIGTVYLQMFCAEGVVAFSIYTIVIGDPLTGMIGLQMAHSSLVYIGPFSTIINTYAILSSKCGAECDLVPVTVEITE